MSEKNEWVFAEKRPGASMPDGADVRITASKNGVYVNVSAASAARVGLEVNATYKIAVKPGSAQIGILKDAAGWRLAKAMHAGTATMSSRAWLGLGITTGYYSLHKAGKGAGVDFICVPVGL